MAKRKKKPQTRYVYLMERTTKVEFKTKLSGRREIKIGVATKPQIRKRQVNTGIPGKVVILAKYYVPQATRAESFLHNKFEKHNYIPKGSKSGAGGTEFYRLTNGQIQSAKSYLFWRSRSKVTVFHIIVVGCFLGYLINKLGNV